MAATRGRYVTGDHDVPQSSARAIVSAESNRAMTARTSLRETVARFLGARVERHSAVGLRLTLSVLSLGLAVWLFSGLLEEVLDNASLVRWDLLVNEWFHQHATAAGLAAFNVITLLGSVGAWVIVAIAAVWLWRGRHTLLLSAWLGTNVGGLVLQWTLKTFVHRARPQYAAAYLYGHSYSFPSGHAMQVTITCFMLVFIGSAASPRWREHRGALFACAATLVLLVGFSRLYLGVHYPSDVVGGFAAGAAWLSASLILLRLADGRPNHAPAPTPS
ncbi:MAG: phosphoesterase PA-phosphatase related protein [Gemmatimonadetes bacterium]|nr:phosphoesterase PA-phosphatase related protein [Gemmatimonadota bacterium]